MKFFSLFFLIIFLQNSYAGISNICLKDSSQLKKARYVVNEVLHSEDKVFLRESQGCLEFLTDSSRINLYNQHLKRYFELKNLDQFSSESEVSNSEDNSYQGVTENCQFDLVKEGKSIQNSTNLGLGKVLNANSSKRSGNDQVTSTLLVGVGRQARIQVDEAVAYVKCLKFGKSYEVEISLTEKDSALATTVGIAKGQRLNIGQIVRNLNGNDTSISLNKGLERHKRVEESVSEYYLILK